VGSKTNHSGAEVRGIGDVYVNASHCRLFLRELRARGIDPQRELARLGISYPEHDDLSYSISGAQFTEFLRMVQNLSQDPDIGLSAGQAFRADDTGFLGLLVRSCTDGLAGYEHYMQYRGAIQSALDLESSLLDGMLIFRRRMPGVPPQRILSEYFLARTITVTREHLGHVEPLEVRFMHPRPPSIAQHIRIFGERLRFGASEDTVVLPADILSRSMLHHDPAVTGVLVEHVKRLPGVRPSGPADVVESARRAISERLPHGRVTARVVARRLRINERTLRRQLRILDTSFQQLLDGVRREQALRHLRDHVVSGSELSKRLGYHAPPAFYRAFRRWTGLTLRAYRQRYTSKVDTQVRLRGRPLYLVDPT
jgi:AraC-like DNA-binding protein